MALGATLVVTCGSGGGCGGGLANLPAGTVWVPRHDNGDHDSVLKPKSMPQPDALEQTDPRNVKRHLAADGPCEWITAPPLELEYGVSGTSSPAVNNAPTEPPGPAPYPVGDPRRWLATFDPAHCKWGLAQGTTRAGKGVSASGQSHAPFWGRAVGRGERC